MVTTRTQRHNVVTPGGHVVTLVDSKPPLRDTANDNANSEVLETTKTGSGINILEIATTRLRRSPAHNPQWSRSGLSECNHVAVAGHHLLPV